MSQHILLITKLLSHQQIKIECLTSFILIGKLEVTT